MRDAAARRPVSRRACTTRPRQRDRRVQAAIAVARRAAPRTTTRSRSPTGYERAGAAALSVLTEPTFFDGALDHLAAVRAAVRLPLLRKDFIVDEYQLLEARASGADAVLLIVAALGRSQLRRAARRSAGARAGGARRGARRRRSSIARWQAGAEIVGVNNRNLRTLEVDTRASETIAGADSRRASIAVSESGLEDGGRSSPRLRALGYRAFLIGERFMTAPDPGRRCETLADDCRSRLQPMTLHQVLRHDARRRCGAGRASSASTPSGFVLWPDSPRAVDVERLPRAGRGAARRGRRRSACSCGRREDDIARAVECGHPRRCRCTAPPTTPSRRERHVRSGVAASLDGRRHLADVPDGDHGRCSTRTIPSVTAAPGRTIDWDARRGRSRAERRVMLAGGLTPENVGEAIRQVRPYGVDVASGIEDRPGVKNAAAMRAFVAAVARGGSA